ncbi:isomerase [Lysobacter sp. TY2-98]|nr:isomerase [Lysobacter sp. TY2-98]
MVRGENVVIRPGAVVVGHCALGDRVTIGVGAVLDPGHGGRLRVEDDARIGTGATVAAPVTISRGAVLQAGAVVVRDVPPHAIVSGNPAQIVGYTTEARPAGDASSARRLPEPGQHETQVRGVTFHRLPKILDLRGNLSVGEFERSIPFDAKRYFLVFGVPNAEIRGEHAHRTCHQFLICAHGSCAVVADDGHRREEFLLDDPSLGLHLPPLTWGIQYKYSPDAVLLVFASEYYDAGEYIRDYPEFLQLTATGGSS